MFPRTPNNNLMFKLASLRRKRQRMGGGMPSYPSQLPSMPSAPNLGASGPTQLTPFNAPVPQFPSGSPSPMGFAYGGMIPQPQGGPTYPPSRMPPGYPPPPSIERPTIIPRPMPPVAPRGFAMGGAIPRIATPNNPPVNFGQDDQMIPAETGEYVIPRPVVQRKGTEFFDNLVKKTIGDIAGEQAKPKEAGYRHGGDVGGGGDGSGWGAYDIPPDTTQDPTDLNAPPYGHTGVGAQYGWMGQYYPSPNTPGWTQGPTMIPTTFDAQGYPYGVPVGSYEGNGQGGYGGIWGGDLNYGVGQNFGGFGGFGSAFSPGGWGSFGGSFGTGTAGGPSYWDVRSH